jgi:NADH-quinone oxidoreductase subunit L
MESTLHGLHVETELAHVENAVKITAYGTSGAIILLGGVIAWAFYIARKIDPWAFVSGSKTLKQIHTFLWNRWYINKIYYIIFVDGVIFTARMLYNGLEKVFFDNITPVVSNFFIRLGVKSFNSFESEIIDEGINEGVPNLATSIYHRVKKFQTGFLSYNIVYIIFTFLVLLVMFILMFGGLK